MQSTKTLENAQMTLTWQEDGINYSLSGKVKTEFNYKTEYETLIDDNGVYRSQFLTKSEVTATSKFVPDDTNKFFTIKKSDALSQINQISVRIPSLTPENIEKAYDQAGVDRSKEFKIHHPTGNKTVAILTWITGDFNEVWK